MQSYIQTLEKFNNLTVLKKYNTVGSNNNFMLNIYYLIYIQKTKNQINAETIIDKKRS